MPLDSEQLVSQVTADAAEDLVVLAAMERQWGRVLQEIYLMQEIIDKLRERVSKQDTLNKSVLTFLRGLKKELVDAAASDDPAELQAILDSLDTGVMQEIADAIAANTAAEPVADQTPAEAGTPTEGGAQNPAPEIPPAPENPTPPSEGGGSGEPQT